MKIKFLWPRDIPSSAAFGPLIRVEKGEVVDLSQQEAQNWINRGAAVAVGGKKPAVEKTPANKPAAKKPAAKKAAAKKKTKEG